MEWGSPLIRCSNDSDHWRMKTDSAYDHWDLDGWLFEEVTILVVELPSEWVSVLLYIVIGHRHVSLWTELSLSTKRYMFCFGWDSDEIFCSYFHRVIYSFCRTRVSSIRCGMMMKGVLFTSTHWLKWLECVVLACGQPIFWTSLKHMMQSFTGSWCGACYHRWYGYDASDD